MVPLNEQLYENPKGTPGKNVQEFRNILNKSSLNDVIILKSVKNCKRIIIYFFNFHSYSYFMNFYFVMGFFSLRFFPSKSQEFFENKNSKINIDL